MIRDGQFGTAPVLGVRAILQNVGDLILQLIRDVILFTEHYQELVKKSG
jgi:hypothetical protein